MALPGIPWLLLLSLLAAVPCTCEERARVPMVSGSQIQCYDSLTNATTNSTESFRASLLPLLAALPSAAAPTGFASLRSDSDRVFVRGLCFGVATVPSSDCLGCLSAAARNLTAGCGPATRRAGIWADRCFVAYADTDASTSAEDAFRSRVLLRGGDVDAAESRYPHCWLVNVATFMAQCAAANISGAGMLGTADAATEGSTVYVLAQCARDRTSAECVSCLKESVRAVDWDGDTYGRDGRVAAAVVAFNCYLRIEVAAAPVPKGADTPYILAGVFLGIFLFMIPCAISCREGIMKSREDRRLHDSSSSLDPGVTRMIKASCSATTPDNKTRVDRV